MEPILKIRGLRKSFGGIQALSDCSFDVQRGTVTGLVGPNGAGKSTLFNVINGLLPVDGGIVTFNGSDITGQPPHVVAGKGISRTFQIPKELSRLSVLDNLKLVPLNQTGEKFTSLFVNARKIREEERNNENKAVEILKIVELDAHRTDLAARLSVGQKKLLEIARCLMSDPELILLDEPAAGVNPRLMDKIMAVIRRINEKGTSLLIIEHNMDVIAKLCDWVIVLDLGEVLTEGTPREIQNDPRVLSAYLGS